MHERSSALICESLRERKRLSFTYGGRERVVEPYCHGFTAKGEERLRAIQVGGASGSGGFGFGKLWDVTKMTNVRVTEQTFEPDDPDYNPNDSALARIHCRV
jgi:hypothetical protein